MIKFSVIIPIYNVESYIKKSIESVLNQTYSNLELILVDDGSPDKCPEICDEYKEKDSRVKVIHKKNGGLPGARNSGIKIATGEYFMHLDGDDFWDTDYLRQVAPIIEKSKKDIYMGNSRYDYIDGKATKAVLFDLKNTKGKTYDKILQLFFSGLNCMPAAACHNIYSTSFIKNNNLYLDETLTWSEDTDNFFQILFATRNIGFFDYTFYYYRKDNQGAMTKNPTAKHFLSNLSVSRKWFHKVKNMKFFSEETKKIILSRFANGQMISVKSIYCLQEPEFTQVCDYIFADKEMIRYINGLLFKSIFILTRVIGCKKTSRLLNIMKR